MNRIKLISELIRKYKFRVYLEIGTNKGESFFPVHSRHKLAVDPDFQIPLRQAIKWYFKNPINFRSHYFKLTSDDFFDQKKGFLKNLGAVDISLVDGLHTFEQSLKDVLNVLKYLNPGGIIVMHDCYPPDELAATPALNIGEARSILKDAFKNAWCGDVWKTIVYLKEKHSDLLDVCVINSDFGLGIVRKKSTAPFDQQIDRLVFNKVLVLHYLTMKNDPALVNLKDAAFAKKLIQDIRVGLPE